MLQDIGEVRRSAPVHVRIVRAGGCRSCEKVVWSNRSSCLHNRAIVALGIQVHCDRERAEDVQRVKRDHHVPRRDIENQRGEVAGLCEYGSHRS